MTGLLDPLRLAGVTCLSLAGRGPRHGYVFDPHRLSLPCWALALRDRPGPALLVTLDRHFDLAPPPAGPLPDVADIAAVDAYARHTLDVRNVNHVLAAMDLGLVGDAIVIARASPKGAVAERQWQDRAGRSHRWLSAPNLERMADGYGTPQASPLAEEAAALLSRSSSVLLDIDLDCFTTPSDADPTTVLPWPREAIDEFLFPPGGAALWDAVLRNCVALTLAREPYHCGGLVASGRLFERVAEPIFVRLLRTELP